MSLFQKKKKRRGSAGKFFLTTAIAIAATLLFLNSRFRGRARGLAGGVGMKAPRLNDAGLADKIGSEVLGSHPDARINVNVENRVAVLRGQVLTLDEIGDIEQAVRKVSGIIDVRNYLHLQDEDAPNKAASLDLDLASSQIDNTLQHKTLA